MAGESELLIEEIQELTYQLKVLTSTVISGEEALAKALGLQTKAVAENTKALAKNTDAQEENTDATADNTAEVNKSAKSLQDFTKSQREQYDIAKRRISQAQRDRDVVTDLMNEFGRGTTATSVLRDQFEKGSDGAKILTATLEGVANATKQFAGALYRGERGLLVTAKAATTATKPLIEFAETIGTAITVLSFFAPGGMIAKAVGMSVKAFRALGLTIFGAGQALKATNELNEKGAEQVDRLFKSFNELSKSGVNLTGGFQQVLDLAQTLGVTVAELEEFNRLLTTNVQNLSLFGGTAAKGAERFAQVGGILVKELGRELELMGINQNEQREIAMGYMAIQARTGQLMTKNVNQLAKESAAYIKELDLLAELTGTSRKSMQASMEANLAESRYRAALAQAEKQYGKDSSQYRELERAGAIAAALRDAGLKDLATGTLQLAAGKGAVTTPEAIKAQAAGISEIIRDSNLSTTQAMTKVGANLERQSLAFGNVNALIGETVLQERVPAVQDYIKRLEAVGKAAAEAGMSTQDFLKTEQGKRMIGPKEQQVVVDAMRTQQNAGLIMDKAVDRFNGAANISLQASKLFEAAVKSIPGVSVKGGTLATGQPAGGKTGAPGAPGAAGGPGAAGVPPGGTALPDLAAKIVKAEGGAVNARNPYSSASGLGQITRGRYKDLVKEAKIGSKLYGTSFEQYQTDAGLQQEALNAQIENLRSWLASKGLSTTDAAVYLAHVFGPGGARSVLTTSDNVPVEKLFGPDIAKTNPAIFRGVKTVGDLKKVISDKMGGTGYRDGGIAQGPASGYPATLHGTEAVVPLPDGKSIPITFAGMSSEGAYNMGPLSTDTKLTEMIMQRLGLTDMASKKMINSSGLGMNYNLGGTEFGSKIGGGVLQADIADQVGKLVEGGQPLNEALKSTLNELNSALQEFVRQQSSTGDDGMLTLMSQLIDLQRNQNRTSERILQVSQN